MTSNTFARVTLTAVELVGSGGIKVAQLGVLTVLASHANNTTGVCWPKMETLAAECGYKSEESLRPHMKALESAGLVVSRKRWKRRGEYRYTGGEGWEPASNEYTVAGFPESNMSKAEVTYPKDSLGTYPREPKGTCPKDSGVKLDLPELDPKELQANDRIEVLRQQDDWTDAEYRELRAAGYVCHNWKHWAKPPRRKSHDDIPPLPDWVTPELRRAAKAKNITDFRLWPKVREAEKPHVNSRVGLLRSLIANEQEHQPRRHWEEI